MTWQDRAQYLHQFVLHAALDAVDEQIWTTTSMHLAQVDNFNQLRVSAYVTAAQMKFLLLHDGKSEDAIKAFFKDVYEVYLKVRGLATMQVGTLSLQIGDSTLPSMCAGHDESILHPKHPDHITICSPEDTCHCQDPVESMITTCDVSNQRPKFSDTSPRYASWNAAPGSSGLAV